MKMLARVPAILLAALSVAGVALALQVAFGFGQGGANFGERAGNVAGHRVERFMSAAEAQLELEGASDQSTARGPRQRLDGEGGGNFLGSGPTETNSASNTSTGGSTTHNVLDPFIVMTYIIKL